MTTAGPIVAIIQVRMTSTRLPGKVLKPLAGAPLIARVVERTWRIPGVQQVVAALADGSGHDPVLAALEHLAITVVRGSEQDVLARTAAAARAVNAATVIRITSDCPLLDPSVSGSVLAVYLGGRDAGIRYVRTAFDSGFPLGFDTEVFSASTLYEAEAQASDEYEREHVTPYLWRRPDRYPAVLLDARPDRRHWRLVVDTAEDYQLASAIYAALYQANPNFGYPELCALFASQPSLLELNSNIRQRPYVSLL
jgi:spore coat polysaccharide biosynthesis protein SpsF